jgi:hypothetical protein
MSEPDASQDMREHPWMVGGGPKYPSILPNDGMSFKGMSIEDEVALRVFAAILVESTGTFTKDAGTAWEAAACFMWVRDRYLNLHACGDTQEGEE